jgi:hypothetical protein
MDDFVRHEGGEIVGRVVQSEGVAFLTKERPVVTFGRGSTCDLRFGVEPDVDVSVPRLAGRVFVIDDSRIAVENLNERIAFDVKTPDGPLEVVRPGGLLSPPGSQFEIRYAGSMNVHLLRAEYLGRGRRHAMLKEAHDGETTVALIPELTERQWRILKEYAAPIRSGGTAPATHNEVAAALGWSMSLVRIENNEIWSSFIIAGIPMRNFADKRDAIVDAMIRHHLSPGEQ